MTTPPKEISTQPGGAHGKDKNSVKVLCWLLGALYRLKAFCTAALHSEQEAK